MNRNHARRTSRNAQIAGVVLLLAAGGLLAIPSSVWSVPAPAPAAKVSGVEAPVASRSTGLPDADTLAMSLDGIAPQMASEAPPPPPPDAPKTEEEPPMHVEPAQEWRYLGGIFGGTQNRAIVAVGDAQKFVKAGDTVEQALVVAIMPEYLTIEENGKQRYVALADRKARIPVMAMNEARGPAGPSEEELARMASEKAVRDKMGKAQKDEQRRVSELIGGAPSPIRDSRDGGGSLMDRAEQYLSDRERSLGRPLTLQERNDFLQGKGLIPGRGAGAGAQKLGTSAPPKGGT